MDIRSRFLPALVCLVFASAATRAAAAAPTLTTISPLAGATEDTVKSIPYATLLAASDASGGGTISFRFKSLISGTLKKGGAKHSPTEEGWTDKLKNFFSA